MFKRIWIDPLRHHDGRQNYSSRGQLYRTKVGDADGPVLCERTITPTLDSCRALLDCGITGQFEAWHEGDSFARLTGDIEKAAMLQVKEGPVRFVYEPVATTEGVPQTGQAQHERASAMRQPCSEQALAPAQGQSGRHVDEVCW